MATLRWLIVETFAANQDVGSSESSIFSVIGEFYANPKNATFNKVWQQTLTVPFILVVLLGPLVNFKSPTFFTKFNALGMYLQHNNFKYTPHVIQVKHFLLQFIVLEMTPLISFIWFCLRNLQHTVHTYICGCEGWTVGHSHRF